MGGLPYGDIIVIGAIAAFILLRYRAMLGERTGRDADATPARPLQEFERVIQLPEREKPAAEPVEVAPISGYGAASTTLERMRQLDKQFVPDDFLEGARGAFEMVLQAFNERDHDTLTMLLSKDVYNEFMASLNSFAAEGRTPQNTLLAILEAHIDDATLTGNKARIAVKFTSEQVHLVRDSAGDVVEGDPSQQEVVEDRWVFERALTSNDPAWKVVET